MTAHEIELIRACLNDGTYTPLEQKDFGQLCDLAESALASREGWRLCPLEPTEEMLNAARDWSAAKYGRPVGNDGAIGCYRAMLAAVGERP